MNALVPIPRCQIAIRPGTMDDLPFLDSLQKLHTKQVGWMPTKQLEGKIKAGHVIIAEEKGTTDYADDADSDKGNSNSSAQSAQSAVATPVGYCIGHDQYFKRDDVGIIYQLNVLPGRQRSLIGATLVKAMFDRAAWGCRLFCCWCAQDIEANWFWESLGFIPLAYRAGSRGKGRVHIFWQRRIRAGYETTPYWFPAQTSSGSIREDRIVLPIPPGTHWRDAKPIVLPGGENRQLEDRAAKPRAPKAKAPVLPKDDIAAGGLRPAAPKPTGAAEKPKRAPKPKVKNDPKLVAAARELRDRWLEHVNTTPLLAAGKYDVGRALAAAAPMKVHINPAHPKQLPEAA